MREKLRIYYAYRNWAERMRGRALGAKDLEDVEYLKGIKKLKKGSG